MKLITFGFFLVFISVASAIYTSGFWERRGRFTTTTTTTVPPLPASRAEISPSGKCARVWTNARSNCGGLTENTGGTCDRHCEKHGFGFSNCFPTYCLCHTGVEFGRECTSLETWLKHK